MNKQIPCQDFLPICPTSLVTIDPNPVFMSNSRAPVQALVKSRVPQQPHNLSPFTRFQLSSTNIRAIFLKNQIWLHYLCLNLTTAPYCVQNKSQISSQDMQGLSMSGPLPFPSGFVSLSKTFRDQAPMIASGQGFPSAPCSAFTPLQEPVLLPTVSSPQPCHPPQPSLSSDSLLPHPLRPSSGLAHSLNSQPIFALIHTVCLCLLLPTRGQALWFRAWSLPFLCSYPQGFLYPGPRDTLSMWFLDGWMDEWVDDEWTKSAC